jgi:hypothetical protein
MFVFTDIDLNKANQKCLGALKLRIKLMTPVKVEQIQTVGFTIYHVLSSLELFKHIRIWI